VSTDAVLTALADPTRRSLLERLRDEGPTRAGDLATGLPISRPAVSQHLGVLHEAGLVQVRPEGTSRVYSIDPDGLVGLRAWVEGFWTGVLADYADEVRRRTRTGPPSRRTGKGNR
jgi:DNA-binding transcriptional ArsR family regulator